MIRYLERTRSYYGALGYPPYQWADNAEAPFAIPSQALNESRLGLVTTAAPLREDVGDQGPGAAYNAAAKFFEVFRQPMSPLPDLRISHIGYDRAHCEADDPATWLPVAQLQQACADGRVGELAPELVGAPTNRSQRITLAKDAPAVLAALRDQQVDLALLVPTWPVCHQTVSLIARYLEEHNLPTVIMGCAKDIVEQAGVPRFYWSNFPLGHSAGKPHDPESQQATLAGALNLFGSATVSRTTQNNPQRWAENSDWQQDFMNVDRMPAAKLAQLREEFVEQKRVANAKRADVGA